MSHRLFHICTPVHGPNKSAVQHERRCIHRDTVGYMVKPSIESSTVVSGRIDKSDAERCDAWLKSVGHTRQDLISLAVLIACEPHLRAAAGPVLRAVAAAGYPAAMRNLACAAAPARSAAPPSTPAPARPAAPADPLAGLSPVERAQAEKITDPAQRERFVALRRSKAEQRRKPSK
jgi:hypothetical protein